MLNMARHSGYQPIRTAVSFARGALLRGWVMRGGQKKHAALRHPPQGRMHCAKSRPCSG